MDREIHSHYKGCGIHSWLAGLSQLTNLRYIVQPTLSVDTLSECACAQICGSGVDSRFALSLSRCCCARTIQTNAPTTPSMTMVHTRVNRTIEPVVMELKLEELLELVASSPVTSPIAAASSSVKQRHS